MANNNGLTAEKMIAAIEEAKGFVSKACDILHCSRQHWYKKLKEYPTVQAKVDEIREKRTDYVESKMMKLIDDLNPTMIIFYLKTQAVTGADGKAVTIRWKDIEGEAGD